MERLQRAQIAPRRRQRVEQMQAALLTRIAEQTDVTLDPRLEMKQFILCDYSATTEFSSNDFNYEVFIYINVILYILVIVLQFKKVIAFCFLYVILKSSCIFTKTELANYFFY